VSWLPDEERRQRGRTATPTRTTSEVPGRSGSASEILQPNPASIAPLFLTGALSGATHVATPVADVFGVTDDVMIDVGASPLIVLLDRQRVGMRDAASPFVVRAVGVSAAHGNLRGVHE
jgi:hypothetical protein